MNEGIKYTILKPKCNCVTQSPGGTKFGDCGELSGGEEGARSQ